MIKERSLIGLAVIAVLAACGGGGGGGSSTTPGGSSQLPSGYAPTQWSITIPNAGTSSSSRRAQYVAPGTQSITLTLLQNNGVAVSSSPQGPYNLGAGQPGCSSGSNGVTCTFSVNAPIGNDVFLANTFSQLNGVSPLGSGAVALSVVQNTTNTASLTLTGPIQSIVVASNNSTNSDTLWNGNAPFAPITYTQAYAIYNTLSNARRGAQGITAPSPILSERLLLIAFDANNGEIINPTTYNQPITLTLNYLNFFGYGATTYNVTLSDTPPSGFGTASSTSANGGTVLVYSPSDLVTVTLNTSVFSPIIPYINYSLDLPYVAANFVQITASLASPPANFSPVPFNLTAEVVPSPTPSPSPSPSPVPPTPTPTPTPTGQLNVGAQ